MADTSLGTLDWGDFPALSHAQAMLALNAKDYKLDVVFQTHIPAMVATLNFYLSDLSFTWRQASILAAKAGGCGNTLRGIFRHGFIHTFFLGNSPLIDMGDSSPQCLIMKILNN